MTTQLVKGDPVPRIRFLGEEDPLPPEVYEDVVSDNIVIPSALIGGSMKSVALQLIRS